MTERQDPVEWSRERWVAHGQPAADQFTAMVAILRTHQAMTASIDATLRTYDLTRTGYLLMTTLQLSREGTRPLGQLSRHLMVHPTTVTLALDQLEKMSSRQRQVVELRYFGGLSTEETAEVLKVSPITVKRDWVVARAWLKGQLRPEGSASSFA